MANMRSRLESGGSGVHTHGRVDGTGGSFRWLVFLTGLLLAGCATSPRSTPDARHFIFERDTFAYANELVWEYRFDAQGKWTHRRHEPKPDYTHHCFVVARSAKQFFQNARFDPALPKADSSTYRRRIHEV